MFRGFHLHQINNKPHQMTTNFGSYGRVAVAGDAGDTGDSGDTSIGAEISSHLMRLIVDLMQVEFANIVK